MSESAHIVIVGAGTSGCVLASRLSQNPRRQVLLVEAGHDILPDAEPLDVKSLYPLSYYNPRYGWPSLNVRWRTGGPLVPFTQGRGIGGGSTVMGMWAVRGFPQDYDEWESLGASGWGWRDVLPFFIKAENDHDFDGPMHGKAGPIHLHRQPIAHWPPFCQAVARITEGLGFARIDDINAEFHDGLAVLPISATERRVSAATAYLTAEVRSRRNLRIVSQVLCNRVTFDGRRATGIEVVEGNTSRTIEASHVILAAGPLQSPTILMRSGVGPENVLRPLGVPLVVERPGVGTNLQNHSLVVLGLHLAPMSVQPDRQARVAVRRPARAHPPRLAYSRVIGTYRSHQGTRQLHFGDSSGVAMARTKVVCARPGFR